MTINPISSIVTKIGVDVKMKKILLLIVVLFSPALVSATTISSFPWSMNSMPDYRDDCDRISGGCGCSVTWVEQGGWNGNDAIRVNPPSSCRNQNGQYCGPGPFEFQNPQPDIYIRFLVRFSANWEENAQDCGLNKQVKFLISHPETRGMVILQNYNPPHLSYNWAPCENTSCNWTEFNAWNSANYSEEWVSIEAHFDGDGNAVEIWIETEDGYFTASENSPFARQTANIGSPITLLEGIGQYYNGCFSPGTWVDYSNVVISNRYIGPPSGFGSVDTSTPADVPETTTPPSSDIPSSADTIMTSDFEENDFSEWHGTYGRIFITSDNPHSGNYCATAVLEAGTHSDNYADYYFGNHVSIGGQPVEEVYLQLYSKFDSGYVWPQSSHKIALLNLTDGQSYDRRYQVMLNVDSNGFYYVEHSYIDTWQFFGLAQNQGSPAPVRYNEWDKLKLYVRLNTPGSSNGIIQLWVNDELKLSYSNVNIRRDSNYAINKLIMSSYATPSSGYNGRQYYDDWILSKSNPGSSENTTTPIALPGMPGPARIEP